MDNDRVTFARTIAREAGEILIGGLGKAQQVQLKGTEVDLVTELDVRSEEYLVRRLQAQYPDDPIRGEESGQHGTGSAAWLIDPLDGTTNFAHGLPIFCVSIAYVKGDQPVLGVVHDPTRDETFWAYQGGGAWLGSRPIRVSETESLDRSLLVTGFPYNIRSTRDDNLAEYSLFSKRTRGVRRLGAAAIDLVYVADGRFDGFWELVLEPWDVAAGLLIVREAGGRVTRVSGQADVLREPVSILATNGLIHDQMLEAFASIR